MNQEDAPQTCPQASLIELFSQLRVPLPEDPGLRQTDKTQPSTAEPSIFSPGQSQGPSFRMNFNHTSQEASCISDLKVCRIHYVIPSELKTVQRFVQMLLGLTLSVLSLPSFTSIYTILPLLQTCLLFPFFCFFVFPVHSAIRNNFVFHKIFFSKNISWATTGSSVHNLYICINYKFVLWCVLQNFPVMLSQGDNFCYPLLKFHLGVLLLVCFANSLIFFSAIFPLLGMWHFTFLFRILLWMQFCC